MYNIVNQQRLIITLVQSLNALEYRGWKVLVFVNILLATLIGLGSNIFNIYISIFKRPAKTQTKKIQHMICEMWHLKPDMWHMTHGGGWKFSKNSLQFGKDSVLKKIVKG